MKTKFTALFALMLAMSAFVFPVSAYAMTDTEPPTITASITGDTLCIETSDNDSGVEAVFIDGKRFNYRVDSVLNVDAREYVGEGETVEIYAVDFAGNKSEVITIENPYHVAPAEPAETPSPAQSNPFTPDGQASVVDYVTESDGKVFYSFTTPEGNVFYLVIDHQRNSENVYFLNAVTENDLLALAEASGNSGSSAIPTPAPTSQPEPEPTPEPEPEPPESKGNGGVIFIVIAILAIGGAGYYFKVLRPKQLAASIDDDEPEYDEDDEEMEFEDEIPDEDDGESDDEL